MPGYVRKRNTKTIYKNCTFFRRSIPTYHRKSRVRTCADPRVIRSKLPTPSATTVLGFHRTRTCCYIDVWKTRDTSVDFKANRHRPLPGDTLDRAPGFEPGGRRFESVRARNIKRLQISEIRSSNPSDHSRLNLRNGQPSLPFEPPTAPRAARIRPDAPEKRGSGILWPSRWGRPIFFLVHALPVRQHGPGLRRRYW